MENLNNFEAPARDGTVTPFNTAADQFVSGGLISQSSLIKYRSSFESAAAVAPAEALLISPAKVEGEVLVVNGFPAGRGGSGGGTDNSKICPHWDRYYKEPCVRNSVIANHKPTQMMKTLTLPPWSCIAKSGKKLAAGPSPFIPIRTPMALPTPTPMALPTSTPTPVPPLQVKPAKTPIKDTTVANTTYWTPDDDGIEVKTLPPEFTGKLKSAKDDVYAYINEVLYGKSEKKRLPVFEELCPE